MKQCITENMPINDYHNHDGLSNSGLKLILDCPARYYTEYLDPKKPVKEKKDHFCLGTAVHSLVLEPEKFFSDNYVMPKCDRRTTKGKELYAGSMALAGNKNLIDEEEYMQALAMQESLFKRIKWLRPVLKDAKIEQSFFWVDDEFNIQLKSRPDAYTDDYYIDIKTTDSLKDFSRDVYKYNYHTQASMAREALRKLKGIAYYNFIYVVVEESYPHLTAAFALDEDYLDKGYAQFRTGAEIYSNCIKNNEWPDYGSDVQQISLPKWMI